MEFKTQEYKILAFVMFMKNVRKNGILYSGETNSAFVKKHSLLISNATFNKYMKICRNRGYINTTGNHIQFKNTDFIVESLGLTSFIFYRKVKRNGKNVKYRVVRDYRKAIKTHCKNRSFKDMYDAVLEAATCFEFQEQKTKIASNFKDIQIYSALANDKNYPGAYSKDINDKVICIHKKAKKLGKSTKQLSLRVLAKYNTDSNIKYGNRYYGKKLGISPTKSSQILSKLVKDRFVFSSVVLKSHGKLGDDLSYNMAMEVFKDLKRKKGEGPIYIKRGSNEIIEVVGSKISTRKAFDKVYCGLFSFMAKVGS